MSTSTYAIFKPGGNDTALVFGLETDPTQRKKINDAIMRQHPNVEQVGFINPDPAQAELLMAGDEFCGNATRSTAWQVLGGQPGEVKIKVSGVERRLAAGVSEEGDAWSQMPIYADPKKIAFLPDGTAIVAMEGITHIVTEDVYPEATPEELKEIAFKMLEGAGLLESVAAAGVMFISEKDGRVQLRPVVWVRDIKTLFYETACGSGTTAVGLLTALKNKSSVDLPVIQPTGMPINITVGFNADTFDTAVISGPIEVLVIEEELDSSDLSV